MHGQGGYVNNVRFTVGSVEHGCGKKTDSDVVTMARKRHQDISCLTARLPRLCSSGMRRTSTGKTSAELTGRPKSNTTASRDENRGDASKASSGAQSTDSKSLKISSAARRSARGKRRMEIRVRWGDVTVDRRAGNH